MKKLKRIGPMRAEQRENALKDIARLFAADGDPIDAYSWMDPDAFIAALLYEEKPKALAVFSDIDGSNKFECRVVDFPCESLEECFTKLEALTGEPSHYVN